MKFLKLFGLGEIGFGILEIYNIFGLTFFQNIIIFQGGRFGKIINFFIYLRGLILRHNNITYVAK